MQRRSFLGGAAPAVLGAQRPQRNLIFILTDDHRFDMLGCLGHPWLKTPNLDRLARGGGRQRGRVMDALSALSRREAILAGDRTIVIANHSPNSPWIKSKGSNWATENKRLKDHEMHDEALYPRAATPRLTSRLRKRGEHIHLIGAQSQLGAAANEGQAIGLLVMVREKFTPLPVVLIYYSGIHLPGWIDHSFVSPTLWIHARAHSTDFQFRSMAVP